MTNANDLSERAQRLLKFLVERYIAEGQPVSSKSIANSQEIALSSATVRHVMADLEAAGYLQSPHTSAGRVPTDKGYRLFVDSLLTVNPLKESSVREVQAELTKQLDPKALVKSASSLLSGVTQLAGIVTLPKHEKQLLRQVEFLPLSGNRVLVILVLNEKEVQNRIIYTERPYTSVELEQAGNYLTQEFGGQNLSAVHQAFIQRMHTEKETLNNMMQVTLDMAEKAFQAKENDEDLVVAGQDNLLGLAEQGGVDKLKSLFDAFNQKCAILQLLDRSLETDGVQIFIGHEAGYEVLEDCSMITAPYAVDGDIIGVLGVIGPTRLSYDRVISYVDVTSKLLSAALSEDHP